MAEHFDDEVELAQVLPLLCDFKPHQVVVRELPGGRRLLCALRHQADVLLLVKHVHQHLETDSENDFYDDPQICLSNWMMYDACKRSLLQNTDLVCAH